MKITKTLLFICGIISSQNTLAICIRADITGTWRIYSEHQRYHSSGEFGTIRCQFVLPTTGQALSSSSFCYFYYNDMNSGKNNLIYNEKLSGNLNIDSSCHVTGNIKIGVESRNIDGWISSGKDNISGRIWDATVTRTTIDYIFSGIK